MSPSGKVLAAGLVGAIVMGGWRPCSLGPQGVTRPVIWTRLSVKPQPTPANTGQQLSAAARRAPLAVIGRRWLGMERAMGIELTAQLCKPARGLLE